MKQRIYIVEDHPIMQRGYIDLIRQEMDLEVCGTSTSGSEAVEAIGELAPDIVITDLTLTDVNGLQLIKSLRAVQPDLLVLVVSMHDEKLYANRALQAGARGYVMKEEADEVLLDAIRRILRGGVYVSDAISEQILIQFARGHLPESQSPLQALSDRELEVFEHFGLGHTVHQAAEAMLISPKTVESYRMRIKQKLAIDNNNDLIRRAVQWVEASA